MATSNSINEPTISSSSKDGTPELEVVGTHFSHAGRAGVFAQNLGTFEEISFWLEPTTSEIHNKTYLYSQHGNIDVSGNLKIYAPLGYLNDTPVEILQDILKFYGHAMMHSTWQLAPNGDHTTQDWTKSNAGLDYYEHVEDPPRLGPSTTNYLYTTTPGDVTELRFYNYGVNNINYVHEIRVMLWGYISSGTDDGMAFGITLNDSTGVIGAEKCVDMVKYGKLTYAEVWWENLDQTKTEFDTLYLAIEARRGYAGGTPNPEWRLYNVGIQTVWCPIQQSLMDETSFSGLNSYFTSQSPQYLLDGDFYEKTVNDAALEVLAHTPEIFLFRSNDSQLSCGMLQAYADETSPKIFGLKHGNVIKINRIFLYTERATNALETNFDSKPTNIYLGYAESNPEPENNYLTDMDALSAYYVKSKKKTVDRRLFRHDDDARDRVNTFSENYLAIWPDDIRGVDFIATYDALDVEPGDVVAFDDETLGWSDEKFTVVANDVDIDNRQCRLLLYDIEFDV